MGNCIVSSETRSISKNLPIAERIVEITFTNYDIDGDGVLDIGEARNYVHQLAIQMNKKELMIDKKLVPNDDRLMEILKTYGGDEEGNI